MTRNRKLTFLYSHTLCMISRSLPVADNRIDEDDHTQRCCMYFLVQIYIRNGTSNLSSEAKMSARWADLTIRLVVKANSQSERKPVTDIVKG